MKPLNRRETNLITSVSEAYGLVQKACMTHVHVLADLYHMALEQENFSVLETVGGRWSTRTLPIPTAAIIRAGRIGMITVRFSERFKKTGTEVESVWRASAVNRKTG